MWWRKSKYVMLLRKITVYLRRKTVKGRGKLQSKNWLPSVLTWLLSSSSEKREGNKEDGGYVWWGEMERGREGQRTQRRLPRWKPQSFNNLILKAAFYHYYSIVFVRGEPISSALTHKEKITQRCGYLEIEVIEGHFRGCQPQDCILH